MKEYGRPASAGLHGDGARWLRGTQQKHWAGQADIIF